MVETPLARQDVHEPQLDAVHGDRPRDPLERPQPPHLAEPLARVALLPQQLERQAPRSAPMPAPLLGQAAEVRLLLIDPYVAPLKQRRQGVERDGLPQPSSFHRARYSRATSSSPSTPRCTVRTPAA